jgi:drug/metabolite transporter (DMT)-like permease
MVQLLTIRSLVGALFTSILCWSMRDSATRLVFLGRMSILRAIIWAITILFFAASFKYNNMTEVYVIVYLAPIVVILVSPLIFSDEKRRVRLRYFGPIAAMFAGAMLLKIPSMEGAVTSLRDLTSEASILAYGTMLFYAFYFIMTDVVRETSPAIKTASPLAAARLMTLSVFWVGFVILLASSGIQYLITGELIHLPMSGILAVVAAGLLSVAGIFMGTAAIVYGSASEAAPYGYLEVVLAILVEAVLFSHVATSFQIIAATVVVVAALVLSRMRSG